MRERERGEKKFLENEKVNKQIEREREIEEERGKQKRVTDSSRGGVSSFFLSSFLKPLTLVFESEPQKTRVLCVSR